MTKESKYNIVGFVLIGLVMFGFTWYQSRQYKKQAGLKPWKRWFWTLQ